MFCVPSLVSRQSELPPRLLDHINLALMICLALTEVLGREEKDKSSESCGRRMLGAAGED